MLMNILGISNLCLNILMVRSINFKYDCRIMANEFPDSGEIVLAKIINCDGNKIIAELVEYGNIIAYGDNSKLSFGQRGINSTKIIGRYKTAIVTAVDYENYSININLLKIKSVTNKKFLETIHNNKAAYEIMKNVAKMLGVTIAQIYQDVCYNAIEEYGQLINFILEIPRSIKKLPENIKNSIIKAIKVSNITVKYKVRAAIKYNSQENFVDFAKEALEKAGYDYESLDIYPQEPLYFISEEGLDKHVCIDNISHAIKIIQEYAKKNHKVFKISINPELVYKFWYCKEFNNNQLDLNTF